MLHVFAHAMHFLYAMDHYQQYTTPIVAKVCIDTIQKKREIARKNRHETIIPQNEKTN